MQRRAPLLLLLLVACGRDGFWDRTSDVGSSGSDTDTPDTDPAPADEPNPNANIDVGTLEITPLVAGSSTQWNSYVATSGTDPLAWTTPCGDAITYRDCRHAGELQRVDVTTAVSCTGLTLTDSADAFEWECIARDAGVTFVSRRFKRDRGLRDLIDFAAIAFKTVSVTLSNGDTVWSSTPRVLWTNDVLALPVCNGSACTLTANDAIYVAAADVSTSGYTIDDDGIAIVGAPGVRLLGRTSTSVCSASSPEVSAPTFDAPCALRSDTQDRLWIEIDIGRYAGDASGSGVSLDSCNLSELHGVHVGQGFISPLHVQAGRAVRIIDSSVNRGTDESDGNVVLYRSSGSLIRNLRLAGAGLYLSTATNNTIDELTTFDSSKGVYATGASGANRFVRLLAFSHSDSPVALFSVEPSTVVGFTTGNAGQQAFGNIGEVGGTFHLGVVFNAADQGVSSTVSNTTFSHLVCLDHGDAAVRVENAPHRFSGFLDVTDQDACQSFETADPGFTTNCASSGLSDFSLSFGGALSSAFVGPVNIDDAVNTSDQAGAASMPTFADNFDYVGAENRYRGWVEEGGDPTTPSNRSCPGHSTYCFEDTTQTLRLTDFSLRASDTLLHRRAYSGAFSVGTCAGGLELATHDIIDGEVTGGAANNGNGDCEVGEACSGQTYLLAAIELIDDEVGDDDGLCESGEHCLFAPNFGAYQGHGDYREQQCAMADGTVIYAYPTNGY